MQVVVRSADASIAWLAWLANDHIAVTIDDVAVPHVGAFHGFDAIVSAADQRQDYCHHHDSNNDPAPGDAAALIARPLRACGGRTVKPDMPTMRSCSPNK